MLQRIALAFILCTLMLAGAPLKAAAEKDKIEGLWYNAEQTAKVQIYRAVEGKFWGKIVWLKEPVRNGKPRTDDKNPKESIRSRPLMNLPILLHFVREDDDTYSKGEIYDPKNGKTYSCTITYRSDSELGIRGYIGISMIGRTTTWKRAE